MKRVIIFTFLILNTFWVTADEGMWIPSLIAKYNIADMQSKGFKLSAEDLYSINQPSIKDAIVHFGGGCTGELISPEGLIITNHHCGYGLIQRHSSIENDFLTHGFWAMTREQELPNPTLTVTFLHQIDDVTKRILQGITSDMEESLRAAKISLNSKEVIDSVTNGTHYTARVAPMFYGNQYFLFVYERFTDVRLVGAPPSDIGKFGGDTDNWMWPRHTGDFALFRIYADKDNKPADYSPDNVPYKPKHYLPISLKGIEPNDFTMVYGYPGRTEQYITSHAVKQVVEISNPIKIMLRNTRLDIMDSYMRGNDTVRIKYASKHASVANGWKKWIGERNGLIRLNAVGKKQELEKQFMNWANQSPERMQEYGQLLQRFDEIYQQREALLLANDIGREAFRGVEINRFIDPFFELVNLFSTGSEPDLAKAGEQSKKLVASTRKFYKDFHQPIDREIFAELMNVFISKLPENLVPESLKAMYNANNGNWKAVSSNIYSGSLFTDSTKLIYYLNNLDLYAVKKIMEDPLYQLNFEFDTIFSRNVFAPFSALDNELNLLYRKYTKGLMEMQPEKVFYPDANSTLRVSFGHVEGYSPRDAVDYIHYTTLDGIIEKSKMGVYDYVVPQRLIDLHAKKDFGRWAVNGTVPVAFLATNHTSGGNSGSPVINENGQLIGVNFDRVWEGTMSDIMFDPDMCRNISLDIRYALFIIDKYAGAGHLINEMTLVE